MARIRTIKPDFWRNEKLSALPADTHMLAAALLTYSDDYGYFNANPRLVEAECCPLRQPTVPVLESLSMLAKVGYIDLGTADDGRRFGRVVGFCEHQRVSHPAKSKIQELSITWETLPKSSGDTPESLRPEGKGKEGKGESADAPFAFIGRVIRLKHHDYQRWLSAFPNVNLNAHLESRDAFLDGLGADDNRRKNWFASTAADLRNKNDANVRGLKPKEVPRVGPWKVFEPVKEEPKLSPEEVERRKAQVAQALKKTTRALRA